MAKSLTNPVGEGQYGTVFVGTAKGIYGQEITKVRMLERRLIFFIRIYNLHLHDIIQKLFNQTNIPGQLAIDSLFLVNGNTIHYLIIRFKLNI